MKKPFKYFIIEHSFEKMSEEEFENKYIRKPKIKQGIVSYVYDTDGYNPIKIAEYNHALKTLKVLK